MKQGSVLSPISNAGFGGATIMASRLVKHMHAESPWEMQVCLHAPGANAELFEENGLQPDYLGVGQVCEGQRKRLLRLLRYYGLASRLQTYGRIVPYLRRTRQDLVHIHNAPDLYTWGLVAKRLGVPVVWHVHAFHDKPVSKLALRLCDHMIFVSESTREHFERVGRLPPRSVVHNGVDVALFREAGEREAAQARLGLAPGRLTLGFVGQLTWRKRPAWAVRAALDLLAAGIDLQMVIVGEDKSADGVHRTVLKRMIRDAGQGHRVHLLGFRNDVPEIMEAIDVLLFSSEERGEAFPLVVLEAMASRTAVVSTRSAGVPEAITDGVTGLLADADAYDEFVRQVDRVVGDPGLRETLAGAGQGEARERFSIARCADGVTSTYERVLDRHRCT